VREANVLLPRSNPTVLFVAIIHWSIHGRGLLWNNIFIVFILLCNIMWLSTRRSLSKQANITAKITGFMDFVHRPVFLITTPSIYLKMERDPVFTTLCYYLEFRTMGIVHKPRDSECSTLSGPCRVFSIAVLTLVYYSVYATCFAPARSSSSGIVHSRALVSE
jgi:hypothetical protein